jgi:hypothetical protein
MNGLFIKLNNNALYIKIKNKNTFFDKKTILLLTYIEKRRV